MPSRKPDARRPAGAADRRAPARADLLRMTARIVAGFAGRNDIAGGDLPRVIGEVYETLRQQGAAAQAPVQEPAPPPKAAIPIKQSVQPDYLVCLEDGKRLKMLKRHLRATYGMTPEQYRAKWGLPPDYPMVAPNYAAERSAFAKRMGLGRNPGTVRDHGGRSAGLGRTAH